LYWTIPPGPAIPSNPIVFTPDVAVSHKLRSVNTVTDAPAGTQALIKSAVTNE
jgi:hypothetical protein